MMKRIKKQVCIFLILLLLISASGCSGDKGEASGDTAEINDITGSSENKMNDVSGSDAAIWGEEAELTALNTPYIDLDYPASWNSMFSVEDLEEGDSYVLKFIGKDDMSGMCIFYIRFGGVDGQAHQLGRLDDTAVYVYVNDDVSSLSDDQLTRFYELQGCVNDIIIQIQNDEAFVKL